MKHGFRTEGFIKYKAGIKNNRLDRLIDCIQNLNEIIYSEDTLGSGFCIGHSYFCNLNDDVDSMDLRGIVEYELITLISEYWFDEPEKKLLERQFKECY